LTNPFFLPVQAGERFCIYHASSRGRGADRALVYVHPFAEEMNKSRRMAALQSRRFAAQGFPVLQIDLLGCGDSTGDFAEARWASWVADVKAAVGWLRAQGHNKVTVWGLRLGATLAADVAGDSGNEIESLLLWQPVVNGEQFLVQFLRLHLASEMLASGAATTAVNDLRARLNAGDTLEIAGYELHPELASAIANLNLAAMTPLTRVVHWIEVGGEPGSPLRPASRRVTEAWQAKGIETVGSTVAGEPFWSTVEIAECPALLDASVEAARLLK
jgi:exosortase A-associated hydrolase 2